MDDTMWEIAFDLVPEEFAPQLEAQYARAHPEQDLLCGACVLYKPTGWEEGGEEAVTVCSCGTVHQRCICPICGSTEVVTMPLSGYGAWLRGTYIQEALPELSDGQRERLMTGICNSCFPKEEDDVEMIHGACPGCGERHNPVYSCEED